MAAISIKHCGFLLSKVHGLIDGRCGRRSIM